MKIKTISSLALIVSVLFTNQGFAENQTDNRLIKNEIISRDAASGLPSGKRQHKPLNTTKYIDKSSTRQSVSQNSSMVRAGYRLCPDGTQIHPGEKCPEKAKR